MFKHNHSLGIPYPSSSYKAATAELCILSSQWEQFYVSAREIAMLDQYVKSSANKLPLLKFSRDFCVSAKRRYFIDAKVQ